VTAHEWVVDEGSTDFRLDKFLAAPGRLASRGRAADALACGKVFVNDEEASHADASRRLAAGDRIRLWEDRPGSARRRAPRAARRGELAIVYQDAALIVIDKPAGLLAVPLPERGEGSVQEGLIDVLRSHGKRRPLVVHRIDRDTSGLVVFAARPDARQRLKAQFRRREPERVYLAVVYGHPSPPEGDWHDRLVWDEHSMVQKATHPRDPRGKDAQSHYRTVERFAEASLLEIRLVTGRRNQIRLQARIHGHTLVGESRYTYGPDTLRPIDFPRQALHAARLGFRHPVTGQPLAFQAPLPADMIELIARLRRESISSPPQSKRERGRRSHG
jgi:23S rRNA pseudouridine1911/1915/1917 synthase